MYPDGFATSMDLSGVTETLCGASRPGHFQGVMVVLTKLFHLVQPQKAYFGQKDGQQLAVIRKFVKDLNFPLEIVGVPIVREPDGLAMSSRNTYLDAESRAQAVVLNQALRMAGKVYGEGESDAECLKKIARDQIETAPLAEIEYVELVDAETMQPVDYITGPVMLAVAVRFKGTRLIDNILFFLELKKAAFYSRRANQVFIRGQLFAAHGIFFKLQRILKGIMVL